MIPKQAIEKAKESGYQTTVMSYDDPMYPYERTALDPTFWQALGKALGWSEYHQLHDRTTQHRFYDLIITGGDTEKFWEEILK